MIIAATATILHNNNITRLPRPLFPLHVLVYILYDFMNKFLISSLKISSSYVVKKVMNETRPSLLMMYVCTSV